MAEVVVIVTLCVDADEAHVTDPKVLEEAVNADIEAFNEYFQKELKNEAPLILSEKAAIKTYLWWKTHQEKPNAG